MTKNCISRDIEHPTYAILGYGTPLPFSRPTFEDGSELPAGERSRAAVLPERQFHVEERNADKDEHDGVRYEKRATAVTITQVREPPHVAQTHRVAGPHTIAIFFIANHFLYRSIHNNQFRSDF